MEPINPFQVQDGGKTAGMMSYFFVLGWSLAYFGYHQNNKTSLSSYQLRQTLLLFTTYLIVRLGLPLFLSHVWLSTGVISLQNATHLVDISFVVLWAIGLIGAINGEQKPIPLVGRVAQTVFAGI
jgi:uncharacterized membrane protein